MLYTPVLPHPDYDNKVGDILWLDTSYDTETKILRLIVKIKRNTTTGYLADGFKFAINGTGENPLGHAGELAYFYYEALDQSDPKLLVYSYNGGHRSWRCCKGDCSGCSGICGPGDPSPPPAKIASSISDPSWVIDLIAEDNGPNMRTLGIVVDTTQIQNYTPPPECAGDVAAGQVWQGARFPFDVSAPPDPVVVGIWFHLTVNDPARPVTYDPDGFFSYYAFALKGNLDFKDEPTEPEDPMCSSISVSSTSVKVGEDVSAVVKSVDNQGGPLTVTYSGLPAGASVTPPDGSTVNTDANNEVTSNFSYTAQDSDAGQSYSIIARFEDPLMAHVECPFGFNVVNNLTPICNAGGPAGGYSDIDCSSSPITPIRLDGSLSRDPDAVPVPLTYKWTTNCPGGTFDDDTSINPQFIFEPENPDGSPASCIVSLEVSDGVNMSTCNANVSAGVCATDCAGIIGGVSTFDVCGECNGGGNALDRCNVCFGDGQSCLDCAEQDITQNQLLLDGGIQRLNLLVQNLGDKLRSFRGRRNKKERKLLAEADRLYIESWELIYSVPGVFNLCSNTVFCTSVSHQDRLDQVLTNSLRLQKIIKKLSRSYRRRLLRRGFKNRKALKRTRWYTRRARSEHNSNVASLSAIPNTISSCT